MTMADAETVASEAPEDVFADFDNPSAEAVAAEPEVIQAEPEKVTTEPEATTQHQSEAIPAWRLREEAENRRRLESELADLRKQLAERPKIDQPAPDPFADPEKFAQHMADQRISPVEQKLGQMETFMSQMREQFSQMMAVQRFGQEKVRAAYQALAEAMRAGDPQAQMVYQRMTNGSFDPFGDMVNWHQQHTAISQIGGDLDSYNKKLTEKALEDALKNPEFLQKAVEAARGSARQVVRGPVTPTSLPSLNRATAAASDSEPEDVGEVFEQAFGGR